jgi:hypothetical protein
LTTTIGFNCYNCMITIVSCSFDRSYTAMTNWCCFIENSRSCHTTNSADISFGCMSYRSCIAIVAIKRA